MLSFETQSMLIDLLLSFAESERSIESSRQELNDIIKDNSHSLFKLLAIEDSNTISPLNIVSYLERRETTISLNEAQMIIMFYDCNTNGLLTYYEFLNLIQSSTVFLPSSQRPHSIDSIGTDLSGTEEDNMLQRLLTVEVVNIRTILKYLKQLQSQSDYNINKIFNQMKQYNSITLESLIAFFNRMKVNVSYKDITHIMHRLDINRDGKIDQDEFFAVLAYKANVCCIYDSPKPQLSKRNDIDIIKNSLSEERTYNIEANDSNNKGLSRFMESSLSLRLSPKRMTIDSNNTNTITIKAETKPKRFDKLIEEENQFLEYIAYLMQIEGKIEKDKIDLTHRPDFNVLNAFQIFSQTAFITEDDFKQGCSALDIFISSNEVKVMMNRFDLTNEGVIAFASFFDMIIPFESSQRKVIQQRRGNDKDKPFMLSTKMYYQGLLRIIIASEMRLNTLKTALSSLKSNKFNEIFASIDKNNQGYITIEDWEEYLAENKALDDKKAAALVFIRLDRKRCGKVSYSDLSDELTPY